MSPPNAFARSLALALAVLGLSATSARAQDDLPHAGFPGAPPPQVPRYTHPEPDTLPEGPYRDGFTLELSLGLGLQAQNPDGGQAFDELGVGGLDLGLGGFLRPDLALLFRVATTSAFFDEDGSGDNIVSSAGFVGPALQYWPLEHLKLEGGLGLGFRVFDVDRGRNDERHKAGGLGLLLAAGVPFWSNAFNDFELGLAYAPAFVEDGVVHSVSFTIGWQLY